MTKAQDQFNYFTGHKYNGTNASDLASKKYKSNQWATYHQWLNNGYQVQKGEHSTSIMLVKQDPESDKTLVRYYKVFNFEQVAPVTQEA